MLGAARHEPRELLAAGPREHLGPVVAHAAQALGDDPERLVAGAVAEGSLTRLKWSMSTIASDSWVSSSRASAHARVSVSRKVRWFARPVSGSVVAWRRSCSRASVLEIATAASSAKRAIRSSIRSGAPTSTPLAAMAPQTSPLTPTGAATPFGYWSHPGTPSSRNPLAR